MIQINDGLLVRLGLFGLPGYLNEGAKVSIYAALETKVGQRLAGEMTDSQIDEFGKFMDANDEAGGLNWLEHNLPHYRSVVVEEFESVCSNVANRSMELRILLRTRQS